MRALSKSPSSPLAPPTMRNWASGRPSAARARTATSGPLSGWMRPTNNRIGYVGGERQCPAGAGAFAGGEEGVLDTGSDDLDATQRVPVQAPELLLLGVAAHTDRIGTADDLGLGQFAPQRLGVAPLGLHAGERVERRHERHVEVVLEPVADDPAQPVVAVDDVRLLVLIDPVEHAGVERLGDVRKRLLGQVMRSGLDVHDPMARFDEDLVAAGRHDPPG